MGTWGTGIYDDDVSSDVKYEYVDMLRQGVSNEEATQKLINSWDTEDIEEGPIFWFALANIQWDYGRLLEYVKEEALKHIRNELELERWKDNKELYQKRKEVLEKLEKKLNTPMPEEKKISKYRNYICPWEIGDVYAYEIKENEKYKGRYLVFIKVNQNIYAPHNICPIVYVYNKIFNKVPQIEDLKDVKYLPQFYVVNAYKGIYDNILYKCLIDISIGKKRYIKDCVYIGNIKDYIIPKNENTLFSRRGERHLCLVERFEESQIKYYNEWKDVNYYMNY